MQHQLCWAHGSLQGLHTSLIRADASLSHEPLELLLDPLVQACLAHSTLGDCCRCWLLPRRARVWHSAWGCPGVSWSQLWLLP